MLYFVLAIPVAYALGLSLYLAIDWKSWFGSAVWCVVTAAIPACSLLIPAEHVILRAFALLVLVDLFLKLVDLGRRRRQVGVDAVTWSDHVLFLLPFPWLLVVYDRKRRAQRRATPGSWDVVRLVAGAAVFTLCLVLMLLAERSADLRSSLPLEHVTKLALFLVGIESLAQALCGLERLAGFDTTPIIDRAFLSRTPAEFWRRYNRRMHDWLQQNVFLSRGVHAPSVALSPSGGRAAPTSWHSGSPRRSFDGYQAAFFSFSASRDRFTSPRAPAAAWGGTVPFLAQRSLDVGNVDPVLSNDRPFLLLCQPALAS
jgi:hypothetical protein